MHHAMILGNCPTWRTNSFQCIYLFIVLYMFRACHAHHQEKKIVSIQLLVIVTPCWWQCRVHQHTVGKLPRIITSSCLSVCSSAWSNSAPTGRILMTLEFYWDFRKILKYQVSLKSDKNKGYFTLRPIYIFDHILFIFFLEWELFQRDFVEKIKT